MSDEGEITALVNSYALLLDAGDLDAVAELFEHSTWRSEPHGTVAHGIAEIRPIYEKLRVYGDGTLRTKHLLTNMTVQLEPDGTTASSHCYWTVLQNAVPHQRIDVILSGQYVDKFEKVGGTWRFADRLIRVDLEGDPSGHVG